VKSGLEPIYVATAEAGDGEMEQRIEHHRARRDPSWRTIEAPDRLEDALRAQTGEGRAVLVDCLTLWLSNLMLAEADVEARTGELTATMRDIQGLCIVVSNEVGLGLVPDNPLGRRFRDAQGLLNQSVAALADDVVFLAAGQPLALKGSAA
jgi:adenosylcobinamide kinase/adenosylcobinamide-phosphate guanylyltransferase